MATFVHRVRQAADFISRARQEETPDGDPLVAAHNYITAMEIIATVAQEVPSNGTKSDRFFLYQLRQRMELYYERAAILLDVAKESGLVDKPILVGGLAAAFESLHGSHSFSSAPAAVPTASDPVMGVPLASTGSNVNKSDGEPSVQVFFTQPPSVPTKAPSSLQTAEPLDFFFSELTLSGKKEGAGVNAPKKGDDMK